ncbi:MAG: bifunctional diguanylate cyclase/phosphodiesterase [Bacilli bacterium]|nr:bifunctional diguanylate cyclase/phosphodiesterase [Bacilli bacterium]
MKKTFLNSNKRLIIYIAGITLIPGFVRLLGNGSMLVIIAVGAIGIGTLLFVAGYFIQSRKDIPKFSSYNSLSKKVLYVTRGPNKYRVHLEKLNQNLAPASGYSIINRSELGFTYVLACENTDLINRGITYKDQKANASNRIPSSKKLVNEMFFNFDRRGLVRFVTEETAARYGKSFSDFYGRSISDFKDIFGLDEKSLLDALKLTNSMQCTNEYGGNGSSMWVHWNFEALTDNEDEIEIIIASGHEITDVINSCNRNNLIDQQTGLLNQQGLYGHMALIKEDAPAVAFFIDLWKFSRVNDYYGYNIGDRIITVIADELRYFENAKCSIARFSGDKYVVLCRNVTAAELEKNIEILIESANNTYEIEGNEIQVDKRIGYALYPQDADNLDQLISRASLAMQHSTPDNQFTLVRYTRDMGDKLRQNILIASKLRFALAEKIVDIHFQKAVDIKDTCTLYLEELVRWSDNELGYISPLKLFEVAKESNLLETLEKYLVKLAFEKYGMIKKQDNGCITKLAINLAPQSLMDPEFIEYVDACRLETGLDSNDVCIEISESTFVNSLEDCIKRIDEYKARGYLIALDDFGKDYSSLAILERVAFDIIKIDKLFIDKIDDNKNQEIIKMILKIATMANKEIIAEGVETALQSEVLLELGCHIQQGFYLHKPEKMA